MCYTPVILKLSSVLWFLDFFFFWLLVKFANIYGMSGS